MGYDIYIRGALYPIYIAPDSTSRGDVNSSGVSFPPSSLNNSRTKETERGANVWPISPTQPFTEHTKNEGDQIGAASPTAFLRGAHGGEPAMLGVSKVVVPRL